ncbi:MAG: cytochrome c biogenesis protein CcsA [Campylobacteraceae bacterium]
MKFLSKTLFSMPAMAVMLLIFALSCAVATFIENDFGTETAWAVVYNAWWFELIQVLLGVNLIYNIIRFKLYKKEKLPSFIFHFGMILILLGAGLTRYFGYEGVLNIREGKSSNIVRSSEPYIQFSAYKDGMVHEVAYKQLITQLGKNRFDFSFDVDNETVHVKFKDFIPRAVKAIVDAPEGIPTIALTISNEEGKSSLVLREGNAFEKNGIIYIFNAEKPSSLRDDMPIINFKLDNGKFFFTSNKAVEYFTMQNASKGEFAKNTLYEFNDKNLYTIGESSFAVRYLGLKGKETIISEEPQPNSMDMPYNALILELDYKNEKREVVLFGLGRGYKGSPVQIAFDDTVFVAEWGSKVLELPFLIKLNDFQLERYPGSNSPSSYASEVVVLDSEKNITKPYRIYMNNVLDYRGYRFFQASYDQDELGTVLSVNKDPGKIPTYLGYFLLSFGMLFNVLNPNSRFRKLANLIHKDAIAGSKKAASIFAFLLISALLSSPNSLNAQGFEELMNSNQTARDISKEHANKFGTILVQSMDGRIKPIDTLSRDILNKVYRSETYKGLNANQVILSMIESPYYWAQVPFIRVSHPKLKKILGLKESDNYASFMNFYDENDQYKLLKVTEVANRKKDAEKNKFDKDVLKVDERFGIMYFTFTLEMFRIVPKAADLNNTWYSINGAMQTFPQDEASDVNILFRSYFYLLEQSMQSGNWTEADKGVDRIKAYQVQYGVNVMPSKSRVDAEILFNKIKIFDRLSPIYLITGFALLLFIFVKMAAPRLKISPIVKVIFTINLIAFLIHTFGLGLRWFVAEHAPWSNGYESMIYIAWALALSGLFFSRTSVISMALTYILAGITLFVAHLSWMDPQITNLVPVLKSYWLTIHVSVITASYGFLGLCSLLGFFVLILYITKSFSSKPSYKTEVEKNITEATRINEMSMILGLCLLTIGNFLGGVWANESWGRYWGWDPKETWSLISILFYAIIAHFRFIPRVNNQFAFAIFSTIAYASIIMTYFGVNYYLSGMHSYAGGDAVPVPAFVYWVVGIVGIVIAGANFCVSRDEEKYNREIKKL